MGKLHYLQVVVLAMAAVQVLLSQIIRQEPLISENRRPALRQLIHRLIDKMLEQQHHSFTLFKVGSRASATHGQVGVRTGPAVTRSADG